jgi:hypothetical protein
VAEAYASSISVIPGDPAGGFGVATIFAVEQDPVSAVTADFNKDGKLDVAVANNDSNTISVLIGNGNGGFVFTSAPATPAPALGATPTPTPGEGVFTGYQKIIARHSGGAAAVEGSLLSEGAAIIQLPYTGSLNAEWQIISLGDGYYRVMNRRSTKAMAVQGASLAEGAAIVQLTYTAGTDNANDEWAIEPVGSGYYRFINRMSGLALDVTGSSADPFTPFQQAAPSGSANQQFQITAVP